MLRRSIALGALAFGLLGCAGPTTTLISLDQVSSVVNEVKRQTSVYVTRVNDLRKHPQKDEAKLQARGHFVCGNGDVDFDLVSVKLDLATTAENKEGASFSVSTPGPIPVTPSISGSTDTTNSQELVFTEYPAANKGFKGIHSDKPAPIADTLLTLRKALILGATNQGICFTGVSPNPDKADANTFKLSITVVNDENGGVSIKLAAMNFGVSQEAKSTTGNTITVAFKARNGKQFFLR